MEETLKTTEALLGDLSGFRKLQKEATELLEELRAWRQDQFTEWSSDIQAQIEDSHAPLWSVFILNYHIFIEH